MAGLILLAAFLAQSAGSGKECSISGRVYSLSTGMPLKRVQVQAVVLGVNARLSDATATTDGEGNFRIDHLGSGNYQLMADRNGFLHNSSSRVSCGASDVTIKMVPQGMIYGRVIDDDGEAIGTADITLYRRGWFRGERQLQVLQHTAAQADGTFVLGSLVSGKYYLSATGNARPPHGEVFVENFFPNTTEMQAAVPLSVAAGADVRGLELRVRSARAYSVRGKATGASGEPVTGIPLMLMRGGLNRGPMLNAVTRAGLFEFRDVGPGNYVIQSIPYRNADTGALNSLTAHVPVSVGEGDVEGVNVTLGPGAEITGSVKLDDAPFSQSISVTLQTVSGAGTDHNAQVKSGAFALHSVTPTLYHVTTPNLSEGFYVKAIRFGGRDMVHRELDLSSGAGGTLEILLSSKPGSIAGTVRNSDGDPVADATVSLWTKGDPEVHAVYSDAQGHFNMRDLAPGEYKVIAWESIERGINENPAFRASFENQVVVATLDEGSQANVDLKVVSKAASDAEVAKLP